jgi:hypothetical protein
MKVFTNRLRVHALSTKFGLKCFMGVRVTEGKRVLVDFARVLFKGSEIYWCSLFQYRQ